MQYSFYGEKNWSCCVEEVECESSFLLWTVIAINIAHHPHSYCVRSIDGTNLKDELVRFFLSAVAVCGVCSLIACLLIRLLSVLKKTH
jgi:hypothetical protein